MSCIGINFKRQRIKVFLKNVFVNYEYLNDNQDKLHDFVDVSMIIYILFRTCFSPAVHSLANTQLIIYLHNIYLTLCMFLHVEHEYQSVNASNSDSSFLYPSR